MSEVWKPIPGLGKYQASSLGRLRGTGGGILKVQEERDGRLRVSLWTKDRGMKRYLVHKLVMLAFEGECPRGHQVNHKDGNCRNNRLSNLEYVTPRRNYDHSIELGLHPRGKESRNTKLSDAEVRQIRKALDNGAKGVELASKYGVTNTWISAIRKGKGRKYVSYGPDRADMIKVK